LAIRSTVGKHRNLRVMLVRHREVVDRFGAKQQIWRLVAEERPERSHGSTASSLASVAE